MRRNALAAFALSLLIVTSGCLARERVDEGEDERKGLVASGLLLAAIAVMRMA